MKIIISIFLFVLTHFSYSQILKVEIQEFQKYKRYGDQEDIENTLNEYDIFTPKSETDCYYIIDIDNKKIQFYKEENFISEINIRNIKIKTDLYIIEMYDYYDQNGDKLKTNIILDTRKICEEFIYYYYNNDEQSNNVIVMTKFLINKI